jgi:hypothetical protein
MQPALNRDVRLMGLYRGVECPEISTLAVDLDLRLKTVATHRDSQQSGFAVAPCAPLIL